MIEKPLKPWKSSIFLTIGIAVSSIFAAASPRNAKIEVQFISTNLKNGLDFQRLKAAGITKTIFRAFQNSGPQQGLYFRNGFFHSIGTYIEDLAARQPFLDTEVWAWMISRNFSWVEKDSYLDEEYREGKKNKIRKLDIFNPDVKRIIIKVFQDLAAKQIQGILIQDDLCLRYYEGFTEWGVASFQASSGLTVDRDSMLRKRSSENLAWIAVKTDQVTDLLRSIIGGCRSINPDVKIAMNIYYETPNSKDNSEAWYGHNLEKIADSGIDFIYLMAYHRQIKTEMKIEEDETRAFFSKTVATALRYCAEKLVVKLQTRDWDSGRLIPKQELVDYLNLIPAEVERICFMLLSPADIDYLKDVLTDFTRTDGT